MDLNEESARQRLTGWLRRVSGLDSLRIVAATRLSGGTLQENWRLEVSDGRGDARSWVLRSSAPTRIQGTASRSAEFGLLGVLHERGLRVPEPLWLCIDIEIIGCEFSVMQWLEGLADADAVVAAARTGRIDGNALAFQLGGQVAELQQVDGARFDGVVSAVRFPDPARTRQDPARWEIDHWRGELDTLAEPHPAIEWTLRWLERNRPSPRPPVLCHGDFRTGNYLAEAGGLVAVLDWELAHWGHPLSDLGWFCSRFWRFGAPDREGGGVASREALYEGYTAAGGIAIATEEAHYWEVMANVRWAMISLQQAGRHLSGRERSLELALIGRQTVQPEYEALRLVEKLEP